jgi:hypothetical protein
MKKRQNNDPSDYIRSNSSDGLYAGKGSKCGACSKVYVFTFVVFLALTGIVVLMLLLCEPYILSRINTVLKYIRLTFLIIVVYPYLNICSYLVQI